MVGVAVPTVVQASRVRAALRRLRVLHSGIEGCALISSDGRVVESALAPNIDSDRFGGMCAALLALAMRAAKEAERGELQQLMLEGTAGPLLLTGAGLHGVLVVSATPGSMLGRLIIDAKTAAAALGAIFNQEDAV